MRPKYDFRSYTTEELMDNLNKFNHICKTSASYKYYDLEYYEAVEEELKHRGVQVDDK